LAEHAKQGGCVIMTTHQDLISIKPDAIKKIILDDHYGSMQL
jgi:heme exporter protein A